jgi:hypothetical protein
MVLADSEENLQRAVFSLNNIANNIICDYPQRKL